jgi:hypothetical protein
MKKTQHLLVWSIASFAIAVSAQQDMNIDGKWEASYATDAGVGREAEVIINGSAGTWLIYAKTAMQKRDPCFGRRFPMVVSKMDSTEMRFKIEASKIIPGCRDMGGTLKIVDENTLEGIFGTERAVTLKR